MKRGSSRRHELCTLDYFLSLLHRLLSKCSSPPVDARLLYQVNINLPNSFSDPPNFGCTPMGVTRLCGIGRNLAELEIWDLDQRYSLRQVECLSSNKADCRVQCIDLGSLKKPEAKAIAADVALKAIWHEARRAWTDALEKPDTEDARCPLFIVIDEAPDNLAPAEPTSKLARSVNETLARIATEGRKFGLFLRLTSTVRVHFSRQLALWLGSSFRDSGGRFIMSTILEHPQAQELLAQTEVEPDTVRRCRRPHPLYPTLSPLLLSRRTTPTRPDHSPGQTHRTATQDHRTHCHRGRPQTPPFATLRRCRRLGG